MYIFKVKVKVKFFIMPQTQEVQEDVNMKYLHITDGRQINLHNAYCTYNNQVYI